MKVRIEIDETLLEEEVIIKCQKIDSKVEELSSFIADITKNKTKIIFYKDDKEYYLSLDIILFFDTDGNTIYAHTIDNTYRVKYRLYELEKILPNNFLRISKSSIVNINQVFSINYNFASSSLIEFYKSHKQVYASRAYAKQLRDRLGERRKYEN